jgi:hypothetical protein
MQIVHLVRRVVLEATEQTVQMLFLVLSDCYVILSVILEVHHSQH